jgi:hypothetical protein
MHFGKGYQQNVDSIQHQLNTHKNDDSIPSGEHTYHSNRKKRYRKKNIIIDGYDWHIHFLRNG